MAKQKPKTVEGEEKPEVVKKPGNVYVKSPFADKDDFDTKYEVDEDVTDLFDEERLEKLIGYGLVEVESEPAKEPEKTPDK